MAVLGGGGWGTAVASLLAEKGHEVLLWTRQPELAEEITTKHQNQRYLPGIRLSQRLSATSDLSHLKSQDAYLFALPSFALRSIASSLNKILKEQSVGKILISLTKGVEYERAAEGLITMSQVLHEELDNNRIYALSGPSFAVEAAQGFPTTVVLAGQDQQQAALLQSAFNTERFRVYISEDILGVELGGTIKNIIALAAGISDGLGFGDNAKGALISRGLVEMTRLGTHLGARKETFFGLAGLGDMVITAMSSKSRNHAVGVRIGQGESLESILHGMEMVAEGVYAAKAVHRYASEHAIDLPIIRGVYESLYERVSPLQKLSELMAREPKREEI
ncbi:NAD(P)-dependent glycerol-3-phosphate dehydrogenase [Candidatus Acetothermia bacterium]|nr:NAD(P)-dependent glycerol-3-phosphate dehydrogenase [Candidatus Acetothermia bacterium]